MQKQLKRLVSSWPQVKRGKAAVVIKNCTSRSCRSTIVPIVADNIRGCENHCLKSGWESNRWVKHPVNQIVHEVTEELIESCDLVLHIHHRFDSIETLAIGRCCPNSPSRNTAGASEERNDNSTKLPHELLLKVSQRVGTEKRVHLYEEHACECGGG